MTKIKNICKCVQQAYTTELMETILRADFSL